MAVTQVTLTALAGSLYNDTANAATGTAVKASSATVYMVDIDNTANAAVSYVKFYNLGTGSVVVGTTAPDMILMAPLSARQVWSFTPGEVFGTALTVATVTAGGTAGTTTPSSAVIVRVAYT